MTVLRSKRGRRFTVVDWLQDTEIVKATRAFGHCGAGSCLTGLLLLTACGGGDGGPFVPDRPENVQAVASDGQNFVSWSSVDGADEYMVYWNTTGDVSDTDNVLAPVTDAGAAHPGLVNGQIYYYRVEARAGSEESGLSESEALGTPLPSNTTESLLDVTWNHTDTLVSVAESGDIIAGRIVDNLDGTGTTIAWQSPVQPTSEVLGGVAWNGSIFLAVGGGGTVLSSTDGVNWSSPIIGTAPDADLNAVTPWIDNRFVAVGASGRIFTSDDDAGSSWTESNATRVGETLQGVAWNGAAPAADTPEDPLVDALVAVGNNGTILTSEDGFTWSNRSAASQTTNALQDVIWSGEQYVATGTGGAVVTSPDGRVWSLESSETEASLFGVTYWPQRRLYAVVGSSGAIFTSQDAESRWASLGSGTDKQLNSVVEVATETDTYLVIVGSGGTVLTHQRERLEP